MRHAALALVLFFGGWVLSTLPAQAKPASAEDEVIATEQAREDALMRNDLDAVDKIMADGSTYTHANGRVDTKADFLGALRAGKNMYHKIVRSDTHVHVDGNMAEIQAGLDLYVGPPDVKEPHLEPVVVTIVYQKRNGHWLMLSSQSTDKPKPRPAGAPGASPMPAQ